MVPAHAFTSGQDLLEIWVVYLVTASYAAPAMHELNGDTARRINLFERGGLDPGIDHMSAMKLLQFPFVL